jgi:hypothetical protein
MLSNSVDIKGQRMSLRAYLELSKGFAAEGERRCGSFQFAGPPEAKKGSKESGAMLETGEWTKWPLNA